MESQPHSNVISNSNINNSPQKVISMKDIHNISNSGSQLFFSRPD
jgi:hypothetical protein